MAARRRASHLLEPEETAQDETGLVYTLDADLARFIGLQPQQNRRARAGNATRPAWLESIRLTWGVDLHLLNMSSSGLLVESGIRMTLGNLTDFQLADRDDRDYVMSGAGRSERRGFGQQPGSEVRDRGGLRASRSR